MFLIKMYVIVHLIASILILSVNGHRNDSKPYFFEPFDSFIEVDENDGFSVAFKPRPGHNAHFTDCYYESDTIRGHYKINPEILEEPFPEESTTKNKRQGFRMRPHQPNTIMPDGRLCGFAISNVDAKIPRSWNITVYDAESERNYTEQFKVVLFHNIPILHKNIDVLEGSSYFNYLIPPRGMEITNCVVQHDTLSYNIDINLQHSVENSFGYMIRSLGNGKCGLIVSDVQVTAPTKITLTLSDSHYRLYRNTTYVNIYEKSEFVRNRTQYAYVGDATFITCGRDLKRRVNPMDAVQKSCTLYNPRGEYVVSGPTCLFHLELVRVEDYGLWRCDITLGYEMESITLFTQLVKLHREAVEIKAIQDHDQYFQITCKLKNFLISQLVHCTFTRPDGTVFSVYDTAATKRYLSYQTDLGNGECGIRFQKPALHEEMGLWRCELHTLDFHTGGYVELLTNRPPPYVRPAVRIVEENMDLLIKCRAAVTSQHCYIQAPNGTIFYPRDPFESLTGECTLMILKSSLSDNGTWNCFFSGPQGQADYQTSLDVLIVQAALKRTIAPIIVKVGHDFDLICYEDERIPLSYCRIMSPKGDSYTISRNNNYRANDAAFGYILQNLDAGQCGIRVYRSNPEIHNGNWTCHVKAGRYYHKQDISKNVEVIIYETKETGPSATSINMIITGVAGLIVAIAAIWLACWCVKKSNRRPSDTPIVAYNPRHGGSTDMINLTELPSPRTTTVHLPPVHIPLKGKSRSMSSPSTSSSSTPFREEELDKGGNTSF